MTKKKVIRNFGRENGNSFLKNVIQKSWSAKFLFRPPQTRRQVSVYKIMFKLLGKFSRFQWFSRFH